MNFKNVFNVDVEKKLQSKKILNIKLGFDPTSPDLHLGHFVVLKMAKKFQEMGHNVIIIVGNFTALIGDPSGKNKLRPPMSKEEIEKNAKTYTDQVFLILDQNKTIIKKNSQWLNNISPADMLKHISCISVSQILQREDFKNRLDKASPLFMHEIMYPIMQGLDSVFIDSDIELGGSDQIFNLMIARDLQKSQNMEPQAVLAAPILVGLDGEKKMSKSLSNHIGLLDSSKDKFGKTMSLPDSAIDNWFEILLDFNNEQILQLNSKFNNPKDKKMFLAFNIVEIFHGKEIAENEKKEFIERFKNKKIDLNKLEEKIITLNENKIKLTNLIKFIGWAQSNSDANRKIEQGAVKINENKILDKNFELEKNQDFILSVGKINISKIKLK